MGIQIQPLAQAVVTALRNQTLLRSATNTSTASSSRFSPNYFTADDEDDVEDDLKETDYGEDYHSDEYDGYGSNLHTASPNHIELDQESGYGGASCSSSSIKLNQQFSSKRDKRRTRRKNQRSISLNIGLPASHYHQLLFGMQKSFHSSPHDPYLGHPSNLTNNQRSTIKHHKRHNRVRIVDDLNCKNVPLSIESIQYNHALTYPAFSNFSDTSNQNLPHRNLIIYPMNSVVYESQSTSTILSNTISSTLNNPNEQGLLTAENLSSPNVSPLGTDLAPGSAFLPPPDAVPSQSILITNHDSISTNTSGSNGITVYSNRPSITLASFASLPLATNTTPATNAFICCTPFDSTMDCQTQLNPNGDMAVHGHFYQSHSNHHQPICAHDKHKRLSSNNVQCHFGKCSCNFSFSNFCPNPTQCNFYPCLASTNSCVCRYHRQHQNSTAHQHHCRLFSTSITHSHPANTTVGPTNSISSRRGSNTYDSGQTHEVDSVLQSTTTDFGLETDLVDDSSISKPNQRYLQQSIMSDKEQIRSHSLGTLPFYEVNLASPIE